MCAYIIIENSLWLALLGGISLMLSLIIGICFLWLIVLFLLFSSFFAYNSSATRSLFGYTRFVLKKSINIFCRQD